MLQSLRVCCSLFLEHSFPDLPLDIIVHSSRLKVPLPVAGLDLCPGHCPSVLFCTAITSCVSFSYGLVCCFPCRCKLHRAKVLAEPLNLGHRAQAPVMGKAHGYLLSVCHGWMDGWMGAWMDRQISWMNSWMIDQWTDNK